MTKQEQFLVMVQTAFLANGISLSIEPDAGDHRTVFSASGAITFMDDAMRASTVIPEGMSAHEAAEQFARYALANLKGDLPWWFAR